MTERTNLFAYSEPTAPAGVFVGYVSINREPDGRITLCVREPGDGTKQATIALSPEAMEHMAAEVMAKISGEQTNDEVQHLRAELGRAYRCIQGMHHALQTGKEFAESYHAPTVGAAKRFVYEGQLDGSEYFIGKPVEVLHAALALPAGA